MFSTILKNDSQWCYIYVSFFSVAMQLQSLKLKSSHLKNGWLVFLSVPVGTLGLFSGPLTAIVSGSVFATG